jgi:hypothetical protein
MTLYLANDTIKVHLSEHFDKSSIVLNNIEKVHGDFSNLFNFDSKLIIVASTEKDKEWFKEIFKKYNVGPESIRPDHEWNKDVWCGAGTFLEERNCLFFWVLFGTETKDTPINILKTPVHVYIPAMQSCWSSNSRINFENLPHWYIEGQADYYALLNLDKDYTESMLDIIKNCYIPMPEHRKHIKKFNKDQWYDLISQNRNIRKLSYEYWYGPIMYDLLIKQYPDIDPIQILQIIQKDGFENAFSKLYGTTLDEFYHLSSEVLLNKAIEVMV